MDINTIKNTINGIAKDKKWYSEKTNKPQTPRNLAVSISIEAAELLECFQWSDEADKVRVEDELADILIFSAQLSNVMNIDLSKAVERKLKIDKQRNW